ncbi:MAG: bifunctional phosphopantothenoylcysteine decarboxylase/phosphopantothenate--cysteine ligase CoaBC [Pseudobdellovibrionaceae bacterium]|nr:bifunctional phosphopantothenoylcysteine decarboxylase/phosphopantothenate--cysteine ligase CoaBC [Pseudobdellovibrionaceae bacterium]
METRSPRILLMVTGSIASYKALDLTSKLKQAQYEVRIVLSDAATQFVTPLAFEALSGHPTACGLWDHQERMRHIEWMRWADLILVAPATAHFIGNLAQGKAPDLAGTMALAHDFQKPFLIAPSMNPAMYQHPAIQHNLKQLKDWGLIVLPSPEGYMACQEKGLGRMLDTEEIIEAIKQHLTPKAFGGTLNICITAGGTKVPIDDVRYIGNISSGKTGQTLALEALRQNNVVHLLLSSDAKIFYPSEFQYYQRLERLKIIPFTTPQDLEEQLLRQLHNQKHNVLIQAAAISDFDIDVKSHDQEENPSFTCYHKLSSHKSHNLVLKPREKTLAKITKQNQEGMVVAFKLTSLPVWDWDYVKQEVSRVFNSGHIDLVVHNDWQEISQNNPKWRIFNHNLELLSELTRPSEIVHIIVGYYNSNFKRRD